MFTIGDIVSAAWGRYVVLRNDTIVVLRALDRASSFIVNPSAADYAATGETMVDEPREGAAPGSVASELVSVQAPGDGPEGAAASKGCGSFPPSTAGSDSVALRADPENGAVSVGVERPSLLVETNDGAVENVSTSPHGATGKLVDVPASGGKPDDVAPWAKALADLERALPPLAPIPVNIVLGGLAPGGPRVVLHDTIVWRPCLTRAETDANQPGQYEHCWFMSSGSLYCEECRPSRPRVVVGPRDVIANIRAAIAAGDLRTAWRTVFLLEGKAPPSGPALTPAPAIPPAGFSSSPPLNLAEEAGGDTPASAILPARSSLSSADGYRSPSVGDESRSPEFTGAGPLGNGGSPSAVEPLRSPPEPQAGSGATKAATVPAVVAPPPQGRIPVDDPKDEVASFRRWTGPRTARDWDDDFGERAGIIEYGHIPPMHRARAESAARQLLGPRPRA